LIAAPEKKLSKKEQKKLEKEEADKLLAGLGGEGAKPVEETKEEAKGESEVDEKKRKANQKKKEKKKKAEEAKKVADEPAKELTEEERKAAIADALAKRQAKTAGKASVNELTQTALQEQANRKKKPAAKKGMAAGYDR
jgi:hypothetical protein